MLLAGEARDGNFINPSGKDLGMRRLHYPLLGSVSGTTTLDKGSAVDEVEPCDNGCSIAHLVSRRKLETLIGGCLLQ